MRDTLLFLWVVFRLLPFIAIVLWSFVDQLQRVP